MEKIEQTPSHGVHESIEIQKEGAAGNAPSRGFSFGRMFPATHQHPVVLKESSFKRIGRHMTSQSVSQRSDSNIPAGYTYFGQFIDHDITMDKTGDGRARSDLDLIQERSPSLDLDSLYGGPETRNELLFEKNSPFFKIGSTTQTQSRTVIGHSIPFDLPRIEKPKPGKVALPALIGDPRNDENLAVAQTHLIWLKFHNLVAKKLLDKNPSKAIDIVAADARDIVTRHYQHIVLHDFVKRFVLDEVYRNVIVEGKRKHLTHSSGEVPFMPLEFSVAAYRHGHSQVREEYDWNVNFNPNPGAFTRSTFKLLFEFSEVSGNFEAGSPHPTLPTNWVADFRRLYDFGDHNFGDLIEIDGDVIGLNFAKAIDPFLASALGKLPELEPAVTAGQLPTNNLAALNLRRGSLRLLPSGQDISREMGNVKVLSKADMKKVIDDDFATSMEELGMFERTPLWLYILIEASFTNGGKTLGEMGSIIVCETFRTLVETSKTSILRGSIPWHPKDAQTILDAINPIDSVPEMLLWMDGIEPTIAPLHDPRLSNVV